MASVRTFDFKLFMRVMEFSKPYRHVFWFCAVAAVMMAGLGVLRPYVLQLAIDESVIPKDRALLLIYILIMTGLLLLEVVFQFAFVFYSNWLGFNIIRDLRVRLFDKILNFKMQYFDKSSVGRLTTRAVNDIEFIASIFSQGLFMIAADVLKMLAIACVMLAVSWKLSLIVFAILPLILYATRVFQRAMKAAFEEVRNQVAELNSFVQERLTGMKIVQIFTRERTESKRFRDINDKHRKAWIKTVWYNSIFFPIAEMSTSITIGLVVWYGGLQAIQDKGITLGVIVMFIQLAQMLFTPLRQIADKFNTLQMGMVAANRVFGILDTEARIPDNGGEPLERVEGHIAFENVHFGYNPDEKVIDDLSFEVKPGEMVAVVGSTGSGKTTVVNLLARFYEINAGRITIDRRDISTVPLRSLRSKMALVLQDVFLFADTILNNITLNSPQITEEAVVQAAKEIGVDDFIASLPGGYRYDVKERGGMLSSGQRQLISFLRAYVSRPDILVLDEATSSVDSHSERLLQEAALKITRGRTSIVIAHRLATIKKADTIIVMDKGKIVEKGPHKELLKIENGHYRNLYEVQFLQKEKVQAIKK